MTPDDFTQCGCLCVLGQAQHYLFLKTTQGIFTREIYYLQRIFVKLLKKRIFRVKS